MLMITYFNQPVMYTDGSVRVPFHMSHRDFPKQFCETGYLVIQNSYVTLVVGRWSDRKENPQFNNIPDAMQLARKEIWDFWEQQIQPKRKTEISSM